MLLAAALIRCHGFQRRLLREVEAEAPVALAPEVIAAGTLKIRGFFFFFLAIFAFDAIFFFVNLN
jgi:hypothetical protein